MKSSISKILPVFLVAFASFRVLAQNLQPLPNPAYVTDQTGTLSSQQKNQLEQKLRGFEDAKGSQVVVVIIPTTEPEEIEQYSIRLAEEWKVGRKNVDDGVILVIAKDDRKLRIEVGYGLEGAIPDAYAKRIIENIILPDFRQGQFYAGIDTGVDAIMVLIEGEDLPAITSEQSSSESFELIPIGMFIMFIVVAILRAFVKKKSVKFGIAGGVLLLGWLISGIIFIGIIFSIFSLIMLFASGSGRSGGGYGGFSSGGGFSGGGFSGGGGSVGGGGASGGW